MLRSGLDCSYEREQPRPEAVCHRLRKEKTQNQEPTATAPRDIQPHAAIERCSKMARQATASDIQAHGGYALGYECAAGRRADSAAVVAERSLAEDLVHDLGAPGQGRHDLMPVHQLGRGGLVVPGQQCDRFHWHAMGG